MKDRGKLREKERKVKGLREGRDKDRATCTKG
jgi:hypothetical protein